MILQPESPLCQLTLRRRVARFFFVHQTKWEIYTKIAKEIYQNDYKIPKGHETHQNFPFLGLPKCSKIGIFGMKKYHLATLR
jgi:hypothetical protein